MIPVILCGGSGSRLWPMSREHAPKQFQKLISRQTIIEETYARLKKQYKPSQIYFSTTPEHVEKIIKLFPKTPLKNIIVEPQKRDTAAAMGFVAAYLSIKYPDRPIAFISSDHFIAQDAAFLKALRTGEKIIKQTGKLVDIGVTPRFASTALGYTKIGKSWGTVNGMEIYTFEGHREKPDKKTAESYLQEWGYLWHANYYMWTPKKILAAFKKYAPKIHKSLSQIVTLLRDDAPAEDIARVYRQIEKIAFDYAITEKIDRKEVLIIPARFDWSDIGAWDELKDRLAKTKEGNVIHANHVGLDSSDLLVYGQPDRLIATAGLDGYVVVDTPDALLICKKSEAGRRVKELVNKLKKEGRDELI